MSVRRRSSPVTFARASGSHSADTCALSLRWAFALLLDFGGHRNLIQRHHFQDDELARELGLEALIDAEDFSQAQALRRLKHERLRFEETFPAPGYPDRLAANLRALGELIGLDVVEQGILGFCVLLHTDPRLSDAADLLGCIGVNHACRVLSALLDVDSELLAARLGSAGRLVRAGLLEAKMRTGTPSSLGGHLLIASAGFLQQLRFSRGGPLALFRHAFRRSPPGHLGEEDYRHLGQTFALARNYLGKALAERRPGVNVLLYGPPGTGKTQLSRLLARLLEVPLYEIACTDGDGDPIGAQQRLCSLRAAMSVLHSQPALLVLDEIEDIFETPTFPFATRSTAQKGWINRMLEENSLPCFWLSNDIDCLDKAYIRRFDLVIELPNPPRSQRERIVRECGGNRLGEALVGRLAGHEEIAPAVITRAVRIGRSLHPRAGSKLDGAVESLVAATLKAQGHEPLARHGGEVLPNFYAPELANADVPLGALVDGLRRHPEARLCLYGPPGTGKTAFGHWLARSLERPLMVKRVSDLVSPLCGGDREEPGQGFRGRRRGAGRAAARRGGQLPAGTAQGDPELGDHRGQRDAHADGALPRAVHRLHQSDGRPRRGGAAPFRPEDPVRLSAAAADRRAVQCPPAGPRPDRSRAVRRPPSRRRAVPDAGRLRPGYPPGPLQAVRQRRRTGRCPARGKPPQGVRAASDRLRPLAERRFPGRFFQLLGMPAVGIMAGLCRARGE